MSPQLKSRIIRSPESVTLTRPFETMVRPSGVSQVTAGLGNPCVRQKSLTSDPISSRRVFVHMLIRAPDPTITESEITRFQRINFISKLIASERIGDDIPYADFLEVHSVMSLDSASDVDD